MAARSRDILAIRIEGVGNADGQFYFGDQSRSALDDAATADPDGRLSNTLLHWPSQSAASLRFLPGSRPSFGSQTFELRRDKAGVVLGIFARRPNVYAEATADLDEVGLSLVIDVTGATGEVLWWHREALLLGAESPTNTYAVTRGHLATPQQYHDATSERADDELFNHNHALQFRLVELVKIPRDAIDIDADAVVEWVGVHRNPRSPKTPDTLQLECDDLLSVIAATQLMSAQWRGYVGNAGPVGELWGSIEIRREDGGPELLDVPDPSTDGALFMVAEKHGVKVVPAAGARTQLFGTNTTTWGQSIEMTTSPDAGEPCWEFHSTAPGNPIGLSSSPDTLLLQHLLTGPHGTNHATLDLANRNLGANLTGLSVDEAAIREWGRRVAGVELTSLHPGSDGKSFGLEGWSQDKILGVLGAYLVQSKAGKLKVVMLTDGAVYGSSDAVLEADCIGRPSQDPKINESFDKVSLFFASAPGRKPVPVEGDSSKKYQRNPRGEHGGVTIHADGIEDAADAQMLASAHVERWHDGIPTVRITTNRDKDFDIGDIFALTHSKVYSYDSGATFGIVAEEVLVGGRNVRRDSKGTFIDYTLLRVGAIYATKGYIAPSAEVISFNPATNALTLDANIFSVDSSDPINPDHTGFTADALDPPVVQICTEEGTVLAGASAVDVDGIAGATFTLGAAYAPSAPDHPSAGDIVRVAAHGSANATQKLDWAFKADADNLLTGSAPGNAPKTYRHV